jgi:S-adenosylmethionine:tRNA-ribosyltransferase-isomerase (queuine synthetase)
VKVDLFDFHLPPELIAQEPAEPRDAARLLGHPDHHVVRTAELLQLDFAEPERTQSRAQRADVLA